MLFNCEALTIIKLDLFWRECCRISAACLQNDADEQNAKPGINSAWSAPENYEMSVGGSLGFVQLELAEYLDPVQARVLERHCSNRPRKVQEWNQRRKHSLSNRTALHQSNNAGEYQLAGQLDDLPAQWITRQSAADFSGIVCPVWMTHQYQHSFL
jgi:hypothetical protein